ncbi:MAG: hypothetical protein ACREEM_35290 [Blastocatellia bacterium]
MICVLLCASLSARAADYGDISVTVETILFGHSGEGYNEYRATITNRSPAASHRVAVSLFADAYSGYLRELRREVEVGPASTVSVSLLSPAEHTGNGAAILIDGARQRDPVVIDDSRTAAWTSRSRNRLFLLVSREIEKSGVMNADPVNTGFKAPYGDNDVAYITYKSPPAEWSANWAGYSGLDGVVVTADELSAMPEPARTALLRYVECGGVLIVAGQWEIPNPWRAKRTQISEVTPNPELDYERPGYRRPVIIKPHGTVEALKETPTTTGLEMTNNLEGHSVGFGKIIVTGAADIAQITADEWRQIKLLFEDSRPNGKPYYNLAHMNKDFPVIERIGIPVRGLFALMLVFVFLIGPVNLFWLARDGKRMRMLWTVPAISLVTCLAVAGYALLGEGVSATTRTEAFTILDEASRRATTIGWTAFYSPVTPGDGLHFSAGTALDLQNPQWWAAGGARTMDCSNDQHLASGWVTARVPTYFKFRKSEPRRERLTIRAPAGGRVSVVNGLGAAIRQVWYADRNGKVHMVETIEAGAQATLNDAGLKATGSADSLRNFYRSHDWLERMKYAEGHPAEFLTPGTYLAVLDASPFVEPGLSGAKERKARTLVYGAGVESEISTASGSERVISTASGSERVK